MQKAQEMFVNPENSQERLSSINKKEELKGNESKEIVNETIATV